MSAEQAWRGRSNDQLARGPGTGDGPGQFTALIGKVLPDVSVEADPPMSEDGEWWFDIDGDGFGTAVSWSPGRGFGIYLGEAGYGERPDELYGRADLAVLRLRMLFAASRAAGGALQMGVGQIRKLLGVTQVDLAAALSLTQANISRLESRSNLTLGSLRSIIEAMGGAVELRVRFPSLDVPIALPKNEGFER